MAKKTKSQEHFKNMQRSEKAIEQRIMKKLNVDVTVEELEDVIIELKAKVEKLETELKTAKEKLKEAKKGHAKLENFTTWEVEQAPWGTTQTWTDETTGTQAVEIPLGRPRGR